MAATFSSSIPLQRYHIFSSTLCKLPSSFPSLRFSSDKFSFPPTKDTLELRFSPFFGVKARPTHSDTEREISKRTRNGKTIDKLGSEFSSVRPKDKSVDKQLVENNAGSVVEENVDKRVIILIDKHLKNRLGSEGRREFSSGQFSSARSKGEKFGKNVPKTGGTKTSSKKTNKIPEKDERCRLEEGARKRKWSKKLKIHIVEDLLRIGLDMCSKRGDVMGAIRLYDLAKKEGLKRGQYHYAVLLYLCSSAASGIVQPAKSGSGSRSLAMVNTSNEDSHDLDGAREMGKMDFSNVPENSDEREEKNLNQLFGGSPVIGVQTVGELIQLMRSEPGQVNVKDYGIKVGEEVKNYALKRGYEIYEEMILEKVEMNEAILTSLARMAMSKGNGDMAFNMVKQMKELGINPRLRSYGPALSVFCNSGDVEKAFLVEEHMLAHGVYPEEPELEALMKVSVEASKCDKVYYVLHKLRSSLRKVLPSTADLIEKWFRSNAASRVGKRKWDRRLIMKAVKNGGGGWHGQGWLGKGKWNVLRTCVGADGLCKGCGEKLVTIDLDPTETENFAESVARIAKQRDKNSSFQKFQKWLDCYGPFEAVVDAANVGLFAQRAFSTSKVNEIVNGIRQRLPSKKWPLIVLHNRRVTGDKMEKGINRELIEKWKSASALYATPTGSNDDWYWLYAAIKFKCLLVTNDEMKDHLFQLLGNDFFPRWKERHQVRFTSSKTGPEFHMPPPYSVVIQESEKGHWHIPIVSEEDSEGKRTWLCITRSQSENASEASIAVCGGSRFTHDKKDHASSDPASEIETKLPQLKHSSGQSKKELPQEIDRNSRNSVSSLGFMTQSMMQPQIAAAEKLGSCVIDFQI